MIPRILLIAILALLPTLAAAEKRVALVIGNAAYSRVAPLPNAANDSAAIAELLRKAGFDSVELRDNLGIGALRRALRDFSDRVRDADIAVLFFAGHGIEVNGTNYLIPIDAALDRDIDIEDEAVSLDRAIQLMEPARRLRLVILDACRENPFLRAMRRTLATRSIGRGLAKVDVVASDTLVAFAAKAGSTASDGEGQNSPYTRALVKHLTTPGLDLRLALGRVRDEVLATTPDRQEPFVYGSLGGTEIALVPGRGDGRGNPQSATPTFKLPSAVSYRIEQPDKRAVWGTFRREDGGRWVETVEATGAPPATHRFEYRGGHEQAVLLFDASRSIWIRLDLDNKWVDIRFDSRPQWQLIYHITEVTY